MEFWIKICYFISNKSSNEILISNFNEISIHLNERNFDLYFQNAALHSAVEKGKAEIVQLLFTRPDLDINLKNILSSIFFFIKLKANLFKFNFKEKNILISFQIILF